MHRALTPCRQFLGLLATIVAVCGASLHGQQAIEVRLGVVAYEAFGKRTEEYQAALRQLSEQYEKTGGRKVTFRYAVGSYTEVMQWYEKDLIDAAVLTPGPAAMLFLDPESGQRMREGYVATRLLGPSPVPFAAAERRDEEPDETYHSLCVVRSDGPATPEELLREIRRGNVQFYVTHPLSVSSFLLPAAILRSHGIDLRDPALGVEYTYDHVVSLRRVAQNEGGGSPGKIKVAFVWDGAGAADEYRNLRSIDLPSATGIPLSREPIPQEIVVVNERLAGRVKDALQHVLVPGVPPNFRYRQLPAADWVQSYRRVVDWLQAAQLSREDLTRSQVSLAEVASKIRADLASDQRPARIAVVLSGGGAKCAYQVGALWALEQALANSGLSIDLVAGTSGGAINAFAAALDIVRDPQGYDTLTRVWRGFQQHDFLQPWRSIRWVLGILLGIVEALVILAAVRVAREMYRLARRRKPSARWLALAGLALITGGTVHAALVALMPRVVAEADHAWTHFALLLSVASYVAPLTLAVVGTAVLVAKRRSGGAEWFILGRRLLAALALTIIAAGWITLRYNTSLTNARGISRAFAAAVPQLLQARVHALSTQGRLTPDEARQISGQIAGYVAGAASDAELHRQLSQLIIERKLLGRELVITGSHLQPAGGTPHLETLPTDLYFAYGAHQPADGRFRPLEVYNDILLDAVIGSTLIFPVFPSHRVEVGTKAGGGAALAVDLIDGGFTHNTPIEAAVLWNATHIILIEASPEPEPARHATLLSNTATAFNLLYDEAQRIDRLARGKVQMFELRPRPPCGSTASPTAHVTERMDLIDFSPRLIDRAIEKGKRDAACPVPLPFRRVTGEPNLVAVGGGA